MTTTPIIKKYCPGDYGQLHYRGVYPTNAERPTVVCLHMSPKSGRLFHDLMPHLAQDRMVLAPDYPGHGESSVPPPQPHVNIGDYARAVWQVIETECGTRPVHFVGYHTGSMVAIEATRQRPQQVARIINIGAPVFAEDELAAIRDVFAPIPLDEQGTRFRVMWERVMEHRGPGMSLITAAESYAENLRSGEAYEWGHRAAFDYANEYVKQLGKTQHRILVMNPKDDTHVVTQRIDDYLQNGERRDYLQYGHGFISAYAHDAATEMLNFLSEGDEEATSGNSHHNGV